MLTVFGSTALDTIRTPTIVLKDVLGGAATFAGISSSFFVKTGLIAVVGKDFPKKYHKILDAHLNLDGLTVEDGKTFRYDGKYDKTLSLRTTLRTELNVLENFQPIVPEQYKKSQFVYLANNDPDQNIALIKEFDRVKFSMCDTIEFWISTKRASVVKMFKKVDAKAKRTVFKPNCRLMFGLKNKNYFSSSMDSSDGLSTTLNEMSSQSKKRFVITRMPSENDVFDFASSSRLNADNLILNGGEEYEIVATVNVSNLPKIKKYAKKYRMKLYEIGYVTKGKGVFYKKNGRLIRIKDKGWQHLQKS